jgi:hypothetical protein
MKDMFGMIHNGKFKLGQRVRKIKGSCWTGKVVGFYSSSITPFGYCVESETEVGSVQIYPEPALELAPDPVTGTEMQQMFLSALEERLENIAIMISVDPDGNRATDLGLISMVENEIKILIESIRKRL